MWCQEYLTKLGNTECHPEQFLQRRAALDKLLIIIQNEDIANLIHKVFHISTSVTKALGSTRGAELLQSQVLPRHKGNVLEKSTSQSKRNNNLKVCFEA